MTPVPALPSVPVDVRGQGFRQRAALDVAMAWIDARSAPLAEQAVSLEVAGGRVLARAVTASADLPPRPRALRDGYAVRAEDTVGAAVYTPLPLRVASGRDALPPGTTCAIVAGSPLPAGADAVVPIEGAATVGPWVEILSAVAPGGHVEPAGDVARAGAELLRAGRTLRPADLALLAMLGLDRVPVRRRPRVRLVIAGQDGGTDGNGPMLRALVVRDGGVVERHIAATGGRDVIRAALLADGGDDADAAKAAADVILLCGRSGVGPDDEAPLAMAEAGDLALHGIALRPADSAGLGQVAGVPVVLLPGSPVACLCAYDMLAGRLIRRLAGRTSGLPYPCRRLPLARKLVSDIGDVDMQRVRIVDGQVEPLASGLAGGLGALAGADGFVIVPAVGEGFRAGTPVDVFLFQADSLQADSGAVSPSHQGTGSS